jgi:Gas vesicle synthesis protein GvpO
MASNGKQSGRSRNGRDASVNPAEIARAARRQLAELTGRQPESVLGLHKDDDGWKVTVEVVELTRVPNSTDLLGCYVVALDRDGELVGYERVRRYQRGQVGGDEQ